MKKLLLSVLVLAACAGVQAQSRTLDGVTDFTGGYSGAILNKDKGVDGYFMYYTVDKLKHGDREFAIRILDPNLQDVATKSYVDNKHTFLMKSAFNNDAMMFAMANFDTKEINLVSYDRQANPRPAVNIPLESKEVRYYQYAQQSGDFNVLFPIEGRGFLFNKIEDNKKIGYSLKYYPTDGGQAWEFNSDEKSKEVLSINVIDVNKDVVVALETSRPGAMSRKMTLRAKVIDVNTGALLFEREYSKAKNPRLVNNAFLNADGTVVLMGEYFKDGDNILDDKSLGLFTEVIDRSGKTVRDNLISWEQDVAKVMKIKDGSKIKDKGYIFFHDIVKTQKGDYYAIGEYYKKTVSGGGLAMSVLTGSNQGVTQLTITDAVVFRFDPDFKLLGVSEFQKGKSRAPSLSDFGSPQLNAHALKGYGAFDYDYTQIDNKNDRFYAFFTDYDRVEGEKSKWSLKAIICDEGQLSEDKISLSGKNRFNFVLPSKIGSALLMEYDKKAKTVTMHVEKLNVL
jgi:hypothetical protein